MWKIRKAWPHSFKDHFAAWPSHWFNLLQEIVLILTFAHFNLSLFKFRIKRVGKSGHDGYLSLWFLAWRFLFQDVVSILTFGYFYLETK